MIAVDFRYRRVVVLVASLASIALLVLVSTSRGSSNGHREELLSTGGSGDSYLSNHNWGDSNPDTGMMRVGCGTTVANDRRFWGPVGTTYTVECPSHCAHNGEFQVFGCQIFMDSSAICASAIARNYLGHQNSGIVKFQIQEPIETYPGCSNMPKENCDKYPPCGVGQFREDSQVHMVTTMPWTWQQWKQADKPEKISQYGREGAIEKYRTNLHGDGYRYGVRAFTIEKGDINLGITSDGTSLSVISVSQGAERLMAVDSNSLTVELWVKDLELKPRSAYIAASKELPDTTAPAGATAAAAATTAAASSSSSIAATSSPRDYGFVLGTECGTFAWGVAGGDTESGRMSFISAPRWLSEKYRGSWVHLAGVYDGNTQDMRLYVAGQLVSTGSTQSGHVRYADDALLTMGSRKLGDGSTVALHGELDEVRIWSIAQTKDDLVRYMHQTLQELKAHLVAYWRFDGQNQDVRGICAETAGWNATMAGGFDFVDSTAPVEMMAASPVCKI